VIPRQVAVYSPKASNHNLELLFGTSLYDLKSDMPDASDVTARDGLRLFSPSAALVRVPESFFARKPMETQVLLGGMRDAWDLLRYLLNGGHTVKAGVIAGALRSMERPALADEIVKAMKAAGYAVRERDPFAEAQTFAGLPVAAPAIVGRMQAMWKSMQTRTAAWVSSMTSTRATRTTRSQSKATASRPP
jgi:hypothetical protein